MSQPEARGFAAGMLVFRPGETVSLARVKREAECLSQVHQSVDELDRILHVDIVVHVPVG